MKLKTLLDKVKCPYVIYKNGIIAREYWCNYMEDKVNSIDWWEDEKVLIIYLVLDKEVK